MSDIGKPERHSHGRRVGRLSVFGVALIMLVLGGTTLLDAHDLFLKPGRFFVAPNDSVRIDVLNGTFTSSEAAVTRDRLRDLSLAGPQGLVHPPTDSWTSAEKASQWRVVVGTTGTYTLGASVLPRVLRLEAKDFNSYLEEDGLPDVLADRRSRGELGKPARERYAKHVKTLIQVGDQRAERVDVAFGHAAELVPLANPYRVRAGGVLRVRALVDGQPVVNQVVLSGGQDASGHRITERSVRTNGNGVALVNLRRPGVWYVKFIRMRRVDPSAGDSVDYESKWATLTFAVR
jgi:uncharacterized GH25 family protein